MEEEARCGEAFKRRVAEGEADGKSKILEEAGSRNGIHGASTLSERIKRRGGGRAYGLSP